MRKSCVFIWSLFAVYAVTTSHANGQNAPEPKRDPEQKQESPQKKEKEKETEKDSSTSGSSRQSDAAKDERSPARSQTDADRPASGQSGAERKSSAQESAQDPEATLKYDQRQNRLSVEVDEEVQFAKPKNRDEAWVRGGEVDLRYDRDRNTLSGDVGGTLRLEEIGGDMTTWWQSWWEAEKQQRRDRRAGLEEGAREFIRQYDQDNDGYLTRSEMPQRHRSDFAKVDQNRDYYLSRTEIRQHGDKLNEERSQGNRDTAQARSDDQTWSQWWASWFEDDAASLDRDESSASGARQFIRQHDDDGDGFVTRKELPSRMRDEFPKLDQNQDDSLSAAEIRRHGAELYRSEQDRTVSRERPSTDRQDNESWSEWWAAWWSDEEGNGMNGMDADQIMATGAREFVQLNDDNGDGYLVRSEMPSAMYDDFNRIDQDGNRQVSRREIQRYADRTLESWNGVSR